ncbi:MAG: hypothetical protein JW747_03185 [Candidatus Aminicenantes bacterium]|nr:hypothetical protein [Candidatus Aminicenantes bacterium]
MTGKNPKSVAGKIRSFIPLVIWGGFLIIILFVGYQLIKTKMTVKHYREGVAEITAKYQTLVDEYNIAADKFHQLKTRYNEVLARTIITELKVEGRECSVILSNSEGVIVELPVELDLGKEVFVDYILFGNRLFIRRVFDSGTAPERAEDIFKEQKVRDFMPQEIDWSDPQFRHGKSIYRKLAEGSWMITVTGGGALDIDRKENVPHLDFISPLEGVEIKEFDPESSEVLKKHFDEKIKKYSEDVGFFDVLKFAFGL